MDSPALIDMREGSWGHAITVSASNIKPGTHKIIGHCTPLPKIDDTILFWFGGAEDGKYVAHLKVGSVKPFHDPPDMFVAMVENTGPRAAISI